MTHHEDANDLPLVAGLYPYTPGWLRSEANAGNFWIKVEQREMPSLAHYYRMMRRAGLDTKQSRDIVLDLLCVGMTAAQWPVKA